MLALSGGGIHALGSYEQEAGSSVLFEHCSADCALAVEAVYREQIGLGVTRRQKPRLRGHWRQLVQGMVGMHSLKPPPPASPKAPYLPRC